MEKYDVIIIGGGPGGYHAASLAAESKKRVLLVDKESIGGTCLNWGCIPTKTLLNLAKQYSYSEELQNMGVEFQAHYNHTNAMAWKDNVVKILQNGVVSLLKKLKVTIVQGIGEIESIEGEKKIVSVSYDGKEQKYQGTHIIIASGVESFIPPIKGIETTKVFTSKELLSISEMPKKLVVIGGGVIGIEMAAVFAQLGSQVSIVEALPNILPMMEIDSVKILKKVLLDEYAIDIYCSAKVSEVEAHKLAFENENGTYTELEFDTLLVSTGRSTDLSVFESIGLAINKTGIVVNENMQTNISNVYAIGDVVGIFQLAHVAYRMAEVAVDNILGHKSKIRYNAVPMVIYTNPEMASCGLSEEQSKEKGYDPITAKLPIIVSGRVVSEHGIQSKGQCKIVADRKSGKVLGIHIVSPMASEVILTAAVILEAELSVKDLSEIIFPHPTVGEIIHNVSLALYRQLENQ